MSAAINEKIWKFEAFINDVLKEDLKRLNSEHEAKAAEIVEWQQLQTMITTMQESHIDSFKGKMDIGCNVFAQIFVPDTKRIILSLGAGIYSEFTLEEALQIIRQRIKLHEKQLEAINDSSCGVKARIKLVLHGIQELEKIK